MALMVPTAVDITVASTATIMVVYNDSIISESFHIFSYHLNENPVKLVRERLSLKENIIMNIMGR